MAIAFNVFVKFCMLAVYMKSEQTMVGSYPYFVVFLIKWQIYVFPLVGCGLMLIA